MIEKSSIPSSIIRHRSSMVFALLALLAGAPSAFSQPAGSTPPLSPQTVVSESDTDTHDIDAGESDMEPQLRRFVKWNEYNGPHFTLRLGGGLLYDVADFTQDAASRAQFDLQPGGKWRDGRVVLKGGFPSLRRKVTFSLGIMYDGPSDTWLFRETGFMFAFPELNGHLFVGRTKEGFSMNKVMVGYAGWTMERATVNDATIPILADGIKWLGYNERRHFIWNLGFYGDWLSDDQSFSTYHHQVSGRFAWLPLYSEDNKLFHLGVNLRWGQPEDDKIKLRSRPEVFLTDYFVDTGDIPATGTKMAGYEVYYRRGSVLVGSEYWFTNVSPTTATSSVSDPAHPVFHGGDVAMTWLITGETRGYNTVGGFFRQVAPATSVFNGGRGAWELVMRYSTIDLDSHNIRGGKFWRLTPMLNWYLTPILRLEFAYGYGRLDRFDLKGTTQFFQSRLQLAL